MDLIKDVAATNTATLDLMIEKGVLTVDDLKRWEKLKTRNLAKFDQIASSIEEQANKIFKEELEKQKALILQEQVSLPTKQDSEPAPAKKPQTIGGYLKAIFCKVV